MSNSQIGWAPPERVTRSVTLPDSLDAEIEEIARIKRSTPSALLADAVANAIAEGWTASQEPVAPGAPGAERTIALDPKVSEALDKRLEAYLADGRDTDISKLISMLVAYYVHNRLRRVADEDTPGDEPA